MAQSISPIIWLNHPTILSIPLIWMIVDIFLGGFCLACSSWHVIGGDVSSSGCGCASGASGQMVIVALKAFIV